MERKRKYIVLSDEALNILRETIISEMKEEVMSEITSSLKSFVSDFVGSILDFPLTVRQTAQLTGRSVENIYKMCQRGTIPYTKRGGQLHINLKDISSRLILTPEGD